MFTHKLWLDFSLAIVTIGTEGDIVCDTGITQVGFIWAEDKQAMQHLHGPEKGSFTTAGLRQVWAYTRTLHQGQVSDKWKW